MQQGDGAAEHLPSGGGGAPETAWPETEVARRFSKVSHGLTAAIPMENP